MRIAFNKVPPEALIAAAMLGIMALFSLFFHLPVLYPTGTKATFVGIHYLFPLVAVAILGIITFFMGKRETSIRFFIALPCYFAVIFAYFNIKLWIPYINPALFDEFYWQLDQWGRPLVDGCMAIRRALAGFIPYEANFYMISYIALFYCSFLYHAIRTPDYFGNVIVGTVVLQALGTLSYLIAPAIGPFIYENGVNPMTVEAQGSMLEFYRDIVAHGPNWLAIYGGDNFTVGLAAMPSLHTASTLLYVLYAWQRGRVLLPLYLMILAFILVTAIANRWHYLIDIPAGALLAWVSFWLSDKFTYYTGQRQDQSAPIAEGQPLPA